MFPYKVTPLEESLNAQLICDFRGEKTGFCKVGPKEYVLPLKYVDHKEAYYNFKPRPDDIWIMTFPRSGTTLVQELIWLLNNNLDYETSAKIPLIKRFPFFESNIIFNDKFIKEIIELNDFNEEVIEEFKEINTPGYVTCENMNSPRHIKTHLPFSLVNPQLLDTCKVVYVARSPKDVAVSYFHHNVLFEAHGYHKDFESYWDYFEKGLTMYSPVWEHLEEGWKNRSHPNCLFLLYEELNKDLPGSIRKISNFIGKPVTDEESIMKLCDHLDINNFRRNVPINKRVLMEGVISSEGQPFIRRGKVGGNKEYTEELSKKADRWIESNKSKVPINFNI